MFLVQTTLRTTVSVCIVLVGACVLTGFISSEYKRERQSLGESHYQAGQSFMGKGDVQDAIGEYRKALLFSPDETEYRISLASALIDAGRLAEARSHLEQLLQENPTDGHINLMLAQVAARQHKVQTAVEYYQRAVYEYWPASEMAERRQARWELIGLLSQTGQRNEVVGELMQLYGGLPAGDAQQRLKVGNLLLDNGAVSEASQVFQNLIREAPQNAGAHEGLGQVDFYSGDYISARREYQRTLRLDPRNTKAARELTLTNQVIEVDPELPYITSAERLRHSENLLNRILKDLQSCSGTKSIPGPLQDQFAAAEKLLTTPSPPNADLPLRLEDAAAQLWSERALACGPIAISDPAVETVLPRIVHE